MVSEGVINYFLGLAAGEGCFLVELSHNPPKYKYNVAITPAFKVQMSQDDLPSLEFLSEKMDMGTTHISDSAKDHHDDMAVWQIYHTKDVHRLVELIENNKSTPFNKSKKKDAYEKWSEIVKTKEPYKHFDSEEQVKELVRLSKKVNDNNRGYSTEKWINRVEGNNA